MRKEGIAFIYALFLICLFLIVNWSFTFFWYMDLNTLFLCEILLTVLMIWYYINERT